MRKLNSKTKMGFMITMFSILCILVVVGMFSMLNVGKDKTELLVTKQATRTDVSVGAIQNDQKSVPSITVPEVVPEKKEGVNESTTNNIQLTQIPEKPQPPEKPNAAVNAEKSQGVPLDTNLTNRNKKPTETVLPVEPTKSKDDKPTSGATNSNGEVYVPGFGWVKNNGSNAEIKSQSDGDWNKQIGKMN